MTVTSQSCVAHFQGDGVTRDFALPFTFFPEAEIRAVIRNADEDETPLMPGADFTVSSSDSNASVTCPLHGTPLSADSTLTVYRASKSSQNLDIVENDPFPSKLIEDEFDRCALRDQELLAGASRTIGFRINSKERPSAEQYLTDLEQESADTAAFASESRGYLELADAERASAEFNKESARSHADRAVRISAQAESTAGWWTTFDTIPERTGPVECRMSGDRTALCPEGTPLRFMDAETLLPVNGHVVRSEYSEGHTILQTSCIIPESIHALELGQPVDSAPLLLLTAMPVIQPPTRGVEGSTVLLPVSRLDGEPFSANARFEIAVERSTDGVDMSDAFTMDATDTRLLRLILPEVEADTPCRIRLRAADSPLDWSPWAGPYIITVGETSLAGDDAAVFAAIAEDWPHQDESTIYSKTVNQELAQAAWTTLGADAVYDPAGTGCIVQSCDETTLVLTHASPGLLTSGGNLIVRRAGSSDCEIMQCGSVQQSGTGPYTYTCTGLSSSPASVDTAWAAPRLLAATGTEDEPLLPDTATTIVDGSNPARPVVSSPIPDLFRTSDLNNAVIASVSGNSEEHTYSNVDVAGTGPYSYTLHLDTPLPGTPETLKKKSAFAVEPLEAAIFTDNTDPAADSMAVSARLRTPNTEFRSTAMGFALSGFSDEALPEGTVALWKAA